MGAAFSFGPLVHTYKRSNTYLILFAGQGVITYIDVTLITDTKFNFTTPTFTLRAHTSGGPPTTYTWTRDGEVITRNNETIGGGISFLTIRLTSGGERNRLIAGYTSILKVAGFFPGMYAYTVSNRAMKSNMTASFGIQGKISPLPLAFLEN